MKGTQIFVIVFCKLLVLSLTLRKDLIKHNTKKKIDQILDIF